MAGAPEYRVSARNQLKGTVSEILEGAVNRQIKVALPGGSLASTVIADGAGRMVG